MSYFIFERTFLNRITFIISIIYFLIQKITIWITTYFLHANIYEKDYKLKLQCQLSDVFYAVDKCSDPNLANTWPIFSSLEFTLKESFFCGNISCPQMVLKFMESTTGIIMICIIICVIIYNYGNKLKKLNIKREKLKRIHEIVPKYNDSIKLL